MYSNNTIFITYANWYNTKEICFLYSSKVSRVPNPVEGRPRIYYIIIGSITTITYRQCRVVLIKENPEVYLLLPNYVYSIKPARVSAEYLWKHAKWSNFSRDFGSLHLSFLFTCNFWICIFHESFSGLSLPLSLSFLSALSSLLCWLSSCFQLNSICISLCSYVTIDYCVPWGF
jgi:hypothetical protein